MGTRKVDVQDTQKNDMLTFKVNSVVANHCGVLLRKRCNVPSRQK